MEGGTSDATHEMDVGSMVRSPPNGCVGVRLVMHQGTEGFVLQIQFIFSTFSEREVWRSRPIFRVGWMLIQPFRRVFRAAVFPRYSFSFITKMAKHKLGLGSSFIWEVLKGK